MIKGGIVMMTTKYVAGSIFYLPDRFCLQEKFKSHNYLILGKSPSKLGFIQAMSITSMKNKEVEMEVPILLCNNMISYVVPQNIQSFFDADIDLTQYKGIISDTDIISKKEFLQLLLDIYLDGLGMGEKSHDEVKNRYDTYCEAFFKRNKNAIEYRYKDEIKPVPHQKVENKNGNILASESTTGSESINRIIVPKSVSDQVRQIEAERFDKLHTPAKNWADKELLQFLNVMDTHKRDRQFKLEFTGFDNPRQITDKTYEVRKEARKRKLVDA